MKMKWINLLSVAAFLTLSALVLADEGSRFYRPATIQAGPPPQLAAGVPTHYEDYPAEAYPPGFSSYRGTGFMGSCCEENAPDVACLWKDYCQTKNHHAKLCDGFGHGGKHACGKLGCSAVSGPTPPEVPGLPIPPPPANYLPTRPLRAGPTPAPAPVPTPPAPAVESDAPPVPPSVPGPPAAETTQLQSPLLNGPRGAAVVVPPPSPRDKTA